MTVTLGYITLRQNQGLFENPCEAARLKGGGVAAHNRATMESAAAIWYVCEGTLLATWYQLGHSLFKLRLFFDEQPSARASYSAASFRISRAAGLKASNTLSPAASPASPSPLLPSPPFAAAAALLLLLWLMSLVHQHVVRARVAAAAAATDSRVPPRVRKRAPVAGAAAARPSSATSAEEFSRAQFGAGLPPPCADGPCPEQLLKLAVERAHFFEQRLADVTGYALARMEGAKVRVCSRSRVDTPALEFRTEASFGGSRARTVLGQWECGNRLLWDQSVSSYAYLKRYEPRAPKRETTRTTWHERNDFLRRIGPGRTEAHRQGASEPPCSVEVQCYLSQPAGGGLSAPPPPSPVRSSNRRRRDCSRGDHRRWACASDGRHCCGPALVDRLLSSPA